MSERTIVIGHKNPDTDSICSAIAYSELKKLKGEEGVVAGRAGNVNPQTEFVLKHFEKQAPTYFADIFPRVSDIMTTSPVTVHKDTPILKVMECFKEKKVRFIPILDDSNRVEGTLSPIDLTERFSTHIEPETARKVTTTPSNTALAAEAEVLVPVSENGWKEYSVFVGAMAEESFTKALGNYDASSLIIIVGDREKILRAAIEKGVGIVIVTGNLEVSPTIIKLAEEKGICLMVSPHDSASTAWLVKLSTPASRFCCTDFIRFSPKEKVEGAKKTFIKSNAKGAVVTNEAGELKGVLTNSNFLIPPTTRLVLMDHNEISQAVDGADQVDIVEVVDHHRIGGFSSVLPISFTIQPVGSTCTLVTEKYREWGGEMPKDIAGLLLSGIISDTVTGRSPTTTSRDLDAMKWLEECTGRERDELSVQIFGASSILGQKPERDVIFNDFKEFDIQGKKLGVGQVEVVGFDRFEKVKENLIKELGSIREEKGYYLAALMVTDITYEVTLLTTVGTEEVYEAMGLPEREKNVYEMKDVLSRKKQVIPHLHNVISQV